MRTRASALLLVIVPVIFTVAFIWLGSSFDYPNVLRKPTAEILSAFRAGEATILPAWWLMFLAAALFIPVSAVTPGLLGMRRGRELSLALGISAGLVQMIGLARWIFAVPVLAKMDADSASSQFARAMFELLHNLLGVGLGEFLGYLFTGAWTLVVAVHLLQRGSWWLGWLGALFAAGILFGCFESWGIAIAGPINAVSYLAWSIWLIALGIVLFRGPVRSRTPRHV